MTIGWNNRIFHEWVNYKQGVKKNGTLKEKELPKVLTQRK